MIDNIRIMWPVREEPENFVLENEDLFNNVTKTIEIRSEAQGLEISSSINNLKFTTRKSKAFFHGSLHKFSNLNRIQKKHNYNDFSYTDLCSTIDHIYQLIPLVDKAHLTTIEFGLNINTTEEPKKIIENNCYLHNYKAHSEKYSSRDKGKLKNFEHAHYEFKLRDKSTQYISYPYNYTGVPNKVLRVEQRHLRKSMFNKIGLIKLNDLKNKVILKSLFEEYMKRFEQLILIDEFNSSNIDEVHFKIINSYTHDQFWNQLKEQKVHPQKLSRMKKEFQELLENNNLLRIKNQIRRRLIFKFHKLIEE